MIHESGRGTVLKVSLALIGVVSVSWLAVAQEPTPKPGPEHQRLGVFVGTWKVQGEQKASLLGNATGTFRGTETCKWFAGNLHLVCELDATIGRVPYREMATLSYDPEGKTYTWFDIDNMGMNALGHGTLQAGTWTFVWETTAGGKRLRTRFRTVEQSPTVHLNTWDLSVDGGAWVPVGNSIATKVTTPQ